MMDQEKEGNMKEDLSELHPVKVWGFCCCTTALKEETFLLTPSNVAAATMGQLSSA